MGGWFLRAEPGFRMIPGDVRDMGNTYQANLLVVRPGAPTQQLDAGFRVEAGKITAINLTPRHRLPGADRAPGAPYRRSRTSSPTRPGWAWACQPGGRDVERLADFQMVRVLDLRVGVDQILKLGMLKTLAGWPTSRFRPT